MENSVQVYSITDEYMKSNHVKTLTYELIETLMYFLCAYPIVAMISYFFDKNENMLYLNLIAIVPVVIITYLRVKIKTMKKFILAILLVTAIWLIIIGFLLKQYVFMLFLIIWVIDCIKRSTAVQRVGFNKYRLLIVEALLIPQIIIAAGANFKNFQVFIAVISIVIMSISIGYICKVRNVRLSMDDIENESFNKKDNNIFIGGAIFLILITIFILYSLGIFGVAYDLTRKISKSLLELGMGNHSEHSSNEIKNIMNDNNVNMFDGLNADNLEPPGKFAQIFSDIVKVISNIIFIVITITLSYLLINRFLIYIKMLRNKDKVSFVFNSSNKENEIKKKVDKIKNDIRKSIFLNDKEKIRKLYKNRILKYKKNNIIINNFFSTYEIQNEVLSKSLDNIEDITKVYEKARYSNEELTKDDMEIFKGNKKESLLNKYKVNYF